MKINCSTYPTVWASSSKCFPSSGRVQLPFFASLLWYDCYLNSFFSTVSTVCLSYLQVLIVFVFNDCSVSLSRCTFFVLIFCQKVFFLIKGILQEVSWGGTYLIPCIGNLHCF